MLRIGVSRRGWNTLVSFSFFVFWKQALGYHPQAEMPGRPCSWPPLAPLPWRSSEQGSEEECIFSSFPCLPPVRDLSRQKNLVLWEYELLAPVPGPSDRAPSLIQSVILPMKGLWWSGSDWMGPTGG